MSDYDELHVYTLPIYFKGELWHEADILNYIIIRDHFIIANRCRKSIKSVMKYICRCYHFIEISISKLQNVNGHIVEEFNVDIFFFAFIIKWSITSLLPKVTKMIGNLKLFSVPISFDVWRLMLLKSNRNHTMYLNMHRLIW